MQCKQTHPIFSQILVVPSGYWKSATRKEMVPIFKQFWNVQLTLVAVAEGHGQLTGTQSFAMVAVAESTLGHELAS
jgi:hypothetical protein